MYARSVVGPAVTFQVRTNDQNITTAAIVNVAGKSLTCVHLITLSNNVHTYVMTDTSAMGLIS